MGLTAREGRIIAAGVAAMVVVGLLAFQLGRGCQEEETATTPTSAPATTAAATAEAETVTVFAPAPAPEPEPAPLEVADASWACAEFRDEPGNQGCVAGSVVDWMAYIAGDVSGVTVTLTGPEPEVTFSLTKGGLHDPGSDAIEWYASRPAPLTPGVYGYYFTITHAGGAVTTLSEDPVMGPYTLPVASP